MDTAPHTGSNRTAALVDAGVLNTAPSRLVKYLPVFPKAKRSPRPVLSKANCSPRPVFHKAKYSTKPAFFKAKCSPRPFFPKAKCSPRPAFLKAKCSPRPAFLKAKCSPRLILPKAKYSKASLRHKSSCVELAKLTTRYISLAAWSLNDVTGASATVEENGRKSRRH